MTTSRPKQGGGPPRVYLDTNLVSGIRKQDLGKEQDALRKILDAYENGGIQLVTSSVTHEEIQKLPAGIRELDEEIYALLVNVPTVDESTLFPRPIVSTASRHGGRSVITGPTVVRVPELGELQKILPDENDARHVYQAVQNGVDYFVTADRKTILSRAKQIEETFPIRVVSPSELVSELEL